MVCWRITDGTEAGLKLTLAQSGLIDLLGLIKELVAPDLRYDFDVFFSVQYVVNDFIEVHLLENRRDEGTSVSQITT